MDGLFDVGVNAPPQLHGVDDGGKVIIRQDHIRGALGHVCARDAHGAADVGHLQGGRVVDAVAGHGDDLARLLPGLDDAHLVLGGHPRENGKLFNVLLQHLLGHKV
ncbi:hypothetical protein SDC9_125679 [bioreactor metagenome]|uniref:Uncharacterized protein n=1 Tax=bioreactor metagenome TaxID=1076179 RepID=A0A645CP41_9ZZZZ